MKLIDDTLKNERGKWSAKRITALSSFLMACVIPLYCIHEQVLDHAIIMLAGEFLTTTLVCLGISSWQKTRIVEAKVEAQLKNQKEELPPEF